MSETSEWRDVNTLPPKIGHEWSIFKSGRQVNATRDEVTSEVSKWLPANPLLVGEPESSKFLPPILVPQFEDLVLRTIRNNFRNLAVAFAACAIAFLGVSLLRPSSKALPFGLIMTMLTTTLVVDYLFALRHRAGVAERALFFYWLKASSRARRGIRLWALISLAVGLLQWGLQSSLGGIDPVFREYGVMYSAVENGEYWRLLAGPYLHYSLVHYFNNVALLLFAGSLTYALFGGSTLAVFALGNTVSALAQMALGGRVFDNYAGVSGGVYTLLGVFIAAGLVNRRLLPKGFWWLSVNLTLLGVLSSEILSPNAATVSHLCGLLLGCLAGIYYGNRS
ncbi:rhomboid family intramembrane serine protease [Cognatilysobacter bugurensis]|uniref:rhomboid family intramembrane serine protease n=1 Tax=Cognatilysobacter bugurensis TaxID=543356 RepID=UPI0016747971|nr:rhomboid family intramembrane serine protease [Lysobacter bugurensis]